LGARHIEIFQGTNSEPTDFGTHWHWVSDSTLPYLLYLIKLFLGLNIIFLKCCGFSTDFTSCS